MLRFESYFFGKSSNNALPAISKLDITYTLIYDDATLFERDKLKLVGQNYLKLKKSLDILGDNRDKKFKQ